MWNGRWVPRTRPPPVGSRDLRSPRASAAKPMRSQVLDGVPVNVYDEHGTTSFAYAVDVLHVTYEEVIDPDAASSIELRLAR